MDLPIDGLLVLDKRRGWTSHQVVARVRRLTGQRRTGHAGTLDPLATGVLPLGLGQGTRVLQYLSESGKTYRAMIRLGVSTDTYDAEGAVTATAPVAGVTRAAVAAVLTRFRGTIEQRPPLYSALKRAGRPLYEYARAGIEVEVAPRLVRVEGIELLHFEPPYLKLEIACGSGFYVRSLAHDLGRALGCGAHLTDLIRTRAGPFQIEDAISIEALVEVVAQGRLVDRLWALDAPLRTRPAVILAEAHSADVVNGKSLRLPPGCGSRAGELCRAYSTAGEFLAILDLDAEGSARPVKVFPEGRRGPNLPEPYPTELPSSIDRAL